MVRPVLESDRFSWAPSPNTSRKLFQEIVRGWYSRLRALIGAKSVEQAIEIQSQFAKKAYDSYIAEMSKIGEMYVAMARNAYKPVAQATIKKGT